jgi:hypothetical protein
VCISTECGKNTDEGLGDKQLEEDCDQKEYQHQIPLAQMRDNYTETGFPLA